MKPLALLSFFCICCVISFAQAPYWQQQVNYNISVTLNDSEHTLDGYEKMEYYNNSNDTLRFIWIHLWPNAYKNDRTAFTEQTLQNGSTDFYFSDEEDRGYINRLAFKVNGTIAVMENHPQHQDIMKLNLPVPLAPHQHCSIETPFHVKLPYNFSRGGHIGQSYQATQWYPKAAVYDKDGWHEMPYLDQGEFYSDFGNYEVSITLPSNYIVAATGEMISENIPVTPVERAIIAGKPSLKEKKSIFPTKKEKPAEEILSSEKSRTVVYRQNDVIDFAWFADKKFIVNKDTLALPSGKIINIAAYSLPAKENENYWKDAVKYIKKVVLLRSKLIGEYPYNTVSAVQAKANYSGGMEYPTITLVSGIKSERAMESVIEHEVGHNWLQAILATNEREHPWMDEGMNDYYKFRYNYETSIKKEKDNLINKRMPLNKKDFKLRIVASERKDQPIETSSEKFSAANYRLIGYYKASLCMKTLEEYLGTDMFDSCMREYYRQWKFKHPSPEDFKAVFEKTSGKNLQADFSWLNIRKTGQGYYSEPKTIEIPVLHPTEKDLKKSQKKLLKRPTKLTSLFSFKETDKYKYIAISPAVGFNMYDKLMIGATIHNYSLPEEKLQFLFAPLYATGSRQLNGVAKLNYHWYNPKGNRIEFGVNFSHFSSKYSLDSANKKVFESFYKTVPYFQYHLAKQPRSTLNRWFDFRTYIITEKYFDSFDTAFRPASSATSTRYVNQLSFNGENTRVLYPYSYQLQIQQGDGFYRGNATGNYFFNYGKTGGMQVRLFASAFYFTGTPKSSAYLYMPKLMAANGLDDYTYSSYFLGRSASVSNGETPVKNAGIAAQQVMTQNSGGLKLRPDLFSSIQGYSEKWVASVNLNSTLPEGLLPAQLPIKVFFDIGTYAEAWDKERKSPKFLYVGGLQLSVFKNVLNIYAPFIYSKAIKNEFSTDPANNKFTKRITFSIDVHTLSIKKLFPQFAF